MLTPTEGVVDSTSAQASTCPGQFYAEYFNNLAFSGTPALTRCEASINYDWGTGSPGPGVTTDNFTVRWTGNITFKAGIHAFNATTDDGMRVYLDGAPLIDSWKDQGPTMYTAYANLTAGVHEVRVEYYEHGGGATAKLNWQFANCPVGQYWAEYFNNTALSGAPALTRCEPRINYNWYPGSPDPSILADGFSVRWTGRFSFTGAQYRFASVSDDGIRVRLDGTTLFERWYDHGPTYDEALATVSAGIHEVQVEFYENLGGATAEV